MIHIQVHPSFVLVFDIVFVKNLCIAEPSCTYKKEKK